MRKPLPIPGLALSPRRKISKVSETGTWCFMYVLLQMRICSCFAVLEVR